MAALFAPDVTVAAFMAVLAAPFLCVVALRAVALVGFLRARRSTGTAPAASLPTAAAEWPRYTVIVPLYGEADAVPGLIAALGRLDYPAGRLEILLAVEEIDLPTRQAVVGVRLPASARVVVVPDGAPRTKPRALNYALQEASGDLVVIYDAEDEPEPDQLRRAAAFLAAAGPRIGCAQARLDIYNPDESWFSRQFSIEYAALFGALLPALERLGLPVPLGGTSNHFRRTALEDAGAWDAFNVTEDADLGIRLARCGIGVAVIPSQTFEEAPHAWRIWLGQRTRWLKGWMQTWLVHMRQPRRLWRELGPKGFIGFQVLMGGLILSALVHPWFYVLAAASAVLDGAGSRPLPQGLSVLWWVGAVNLVAGYVTAMALGVAAVSNRQGPGLARWVVWMPVYWLLISCAAYRALWQLVRQPFVWEKTAHRGRHAHPADEEAERALAAAE